MDNNNRDRIHFLVGPQVCGNNFLGRREELRKLKALVFEGCGSVHLVGPNRIGKSSLVGQALLENADAEKQLHVKLCMGQMSDAFSFWYALFEGIKEAADRVSLWNEDLQHQMDRISDLDENSKSWFRIFCSAYKQMAQEFHASGWRTVLIIDEFDGVKQVFGEKIHYYQFLRSIYSDPDYATCGIIISRRRLGLIEKNTSELSSFSNVFNEFPVKAFSDACMEEVYSSLENEGISLSGEAKEEFLYHTGKIPYLCSMLCS